MATDRKICFDRILPRDLRRAIPFRALPGPGGRTRAITPIGKLWINGSTLRIRFVGGTAAQQAVVKQFARSMDRAREPAVRVRARARCRDPRRVRPMTGRGPTWGPTARSIPAGEPTMNLGWLDEAVAAARVRPRHRARATSIRTREGGIQWNEPAVIRDLAGPPN